MNHALRARARARDHQTPDYCGFCLLPPLPLPPYLSIIRLARSCCNPRSGFLQFFARPSSGENSPGSWSLANTVCGIRDYSCGFAWHERVIVFVDYVCVVLIVSSTCIFSYWTRLFSGNVLGNVLELERKNCLFLFNFTRVDWHHR